MKYLILIVVIVVSLGLNAQVRYPTGFPTQFNSGWNKWGYAMSDSGLIVANRDTTWLPKYSGTVVFRPSNKQFYYFDSTVLRWFPFGINIDTTSLSNRINLKLNIVDTTNKWWGVGKRWADTLYGVNDSTIGYTINGDVHTFQILGRLPSGGGSGTVTSVALSMPSAFTVTGSPITGSGTLSVSGAGASTQYIRGNGTLATTDTSMIPNFYLKGRSLLSGTSPITYNSTTGAIGIPNANNTGQKGAATFNNSDFIDDGAGLISLRNPPGTPGVDTMFRVPGVDSIYFTIDGNQYAIKDSSGAGGGGGTVTSVSGTTNRITVTNPTTTPVVDIAATYVGQTSITTLGTVATGVWNGTAIGATFGGTGQTTVTTGDLLYGSAANTWSKLAGVATGNALISGGIGTAPSWGKIGLTTHVSGILPVANGGTGTATPGLVAGTNISITGTWPNQTINATGGGGSQDLQQTLVNGNATDLKIISTANIYGDSALYYNFHFKGNGRVGDTVLGSLQPFIMYGSSISSGFNADYAYGVPLSNWLQITVTNNAIPGSRITSGAPNNLYDKISTMPYYTSNTYGIAFDAGVNDPLADTNTYKVQLGTIIDSLILIHNFPSGKVLVLSPPYSPGRLYDSVYVNINAAVVDLHGGVAVDIFHPMEQVYTHGGTYIMTSDSLHPSTAGQDYMAHLVADATFNGYYYGKLVVYGSDTTRGNKINISENITYGKSRPLGGITQNNTNGAINLINASTGILQYQDLKFVPNSSTPSVTDSFGLRHFITLSNQSRFGLYKFASGGVITQLMYIDSNAQVLIGSDAASVAAAYKASLGTTYIATGEVGAGITIGGDANTDLQRWRVYKNGNLRGAIGFSAVDGLTIGSSFEGVTIGSISAADGTSWTPVVKIPQGTSRMLVGTVTDNTVGTLQVAGKITVATHAIGGNSDSALIWDRTTKEYKYAKINTGADGNGIYGGSGSLPSAVTITGAGNSLTMTGTQSSTGAFNVNNTGNGIAISGTTTGTGSAITGANSSSGAGVTGTSSSGFGGNFTSTSSTGLRTKSTPSSTNTIVTSFRGIRGTSGTAAIGMGNAWDMQLTDDAGNDITTARLQTDFTDATTASPDANFSLWTITNGSQTKKLQLSPTGQAQLPLYGSATFTGTPATIANFDASGNIIEGGVSNLLELQSGNIQFNDAYMASLPNTQINLKSRMVRQSYTTPDADFSTLSTRQEGFFILPDITAARNFTMFSGTGVDGVEFYIYNGNTSGSFNWSFSGVTPVKASNGASVTTMTNGVLYHLLGVYNGTARWIVVNE